MFVKFLIPDRTKYAHTINISTYPPPISCENIWSKFTRTESLGSGSSCEVFKVTRKSDGQYFALKRMEQSFEWNSFLFTREIRFLSNLNHENIIGIENSYCDSKYLYICLQLCRGGSLCDRLITHHRFSEQFASKIIRNILEPIQWCHLRNIVHRDLKPENILFETKAQKSKLVIADWAYCTKINNHKTYRDCVGTRFYSAPECARDRVGWELKKIDMWAIGIIAYILVTGKFPYHGSNMKDLVQNIKCNEIKQRSSWKKRKMSFDCKDFIESLLEIDLNQRLCSSHALQHPWILKYRE